MRVVLDTNVLVRALASPFGTARALYDLLGPPKHEVILSDDMIRELGRVLRYDRLRPLHGRDESAIDSYLHEIRSDAEIVGPFPVEPITSDPDDDLVIATAIAGRADIICTLDRHLRHPDVVAYFAQYGIRVLTDVELHHVLRE